MSTLGVLPDQKNHNRVVEGRHHNQTMDYLVHIEETIKAGQMKYTNREQGGG